MPWVRKAINCCLGVAAAAVLLTGCNGTPIDDEQFSDSVLVVDSVQPAAVQADVSPDTDPNTMFVTPPKDDVVSVSVRNLNRTQSGSGIFGDVHVDSFDIFCSGGTLSSSGNPASLTVRAESSASINVLVASGAFKQANSGALLGLTDSCRITFRGQDLGGEPILSTEAVFGVSFVDTP